MATKREAIREELADLRLGIYKDSQGRIVHRLLGKYPVVEEIVDADGAVVAVVETDAHTTREVRGTPDYVLQHAERVIGADAAKLVKAAQTSADTALQHESDLLAERGKCAQLLEERDAKQGDLSRVGAQVVTLTNALNKAAADLIEAESKIEELEAERNRLQARIAELEGGD